MNLAPDTAYQLTEEQEHILSLVRSTTSNIIIRALAGSGKTSTLELIQANAKETPILCLAFNKRIAEEMASRFLSTTTVRTFNSLGHRIWAKTNASKVTLNPRKVNDLLKSLIDTLKKPDRSDAYDEYWEIIHAVAMAKSLGYIPEGKFPAATRLIGGPEFFRSLDESPSDLARDLIDQTLTASIRSAYEGLIDYNDQIYMPALFGGSFPRFPLVLVDEAQDLSPTNHAMLDKLGRSRLIAVGDPWQSIYGFRGAVQGGMQRLQDKFKMTSADLSVSFRCPRKIVEAVHWRVPHMKWIKEGGLAVELRNPTLGGIPDNAVVISRNNAPLFRLALSLLSAGRSVSVAGSDVGPRVIGIMRKLGDESLSRESLLSAIEDWLSERLARQSTTAHDIADCMKVFASFGSTLGQALAYAEHLFSQKGTIRLLTGHKAKGLEWSTVFHLDPWLLREDEQDLNLRYVITTRSQQEYYEINSKDIR